MRKSKYDCVIVGGGIVGAALACALAQKTSLSIALVEAHSIQSSWTPACYHHRVSAISLSSERIFRALGVWPDMQVMRVSPFKKIQVWDEGSSGQIEFNCRDIAAGHLGCIIENNVMQDALINKLKKYPQVELIAPAKLTHLAIQADGAELTLDADKILFAKLVVGADGAKSWVRQQAGIGVIQHDYQQQGLVATVRTQFPHQQVARQVFLPTGPLAFLPLAEENLSSIVWSLPDDQAQMYAKLDEGRFKESLAVAFNHQLGEIEEVAERFTFPLRKQETNHYVLDKLALIGDAAHTVHPLAGQGVNIGLLDAASLVDVMVSAIEQGRSFASISTLRKYERWRKADNCAMLSGVDLIKKLFANEQKPVQQVRGLGLNLTNKLSFVKNIFTKQAVGARNGLPSLAQ